MYTQRYFAVAIHTCIQFTSQYLIYENWPPSLCRLDWTDWTKQPAWSCGSVTHNSRMRRNELIGEFDHYSFIHFSTILCTKSCMHLSVWPMLLLLLHRWLRRGSRTPNNLWSRLINLFAILNEFVSRESHNGFYSLFFFSFLFRILISSHGRSRQ